jgi:predicted ArsR family transcriptional regulator
MWSVLNDNPTREKILLLLKKNGPQSIENLSRELRITSMGIRQHLLSLERKGLIDYVAKRQGIGRPAFLYRLTEKAEVLFPKAYDSFIIDTFRDIEKHEGREKIDEIFRWRKNRLLKDAREAIADKKTIHDKVYGLREFLESEGYFADVSEADTRYLLRIANCPIYKLATEFDEACKNDLQFYRELLGKEVAREQCIIEGNHSCVYSIAKPPVRN